MPLASFEAPQHHHSQDFREYRQISPIAHCWRALRHLISIFFLFDELIYFLSVPRHTLPVIGALMNKSRRRLESFFTDIRAYRLAFDDYRASDYQPFSLSFIILLRPSAAP